MFNKLKQVKDLRSQAKQLQNDLAKEIIQVNHKDCVMKMDGNQKITELSLADDLLNQGSKKKLEEAIIELHGQALKKVQKIMMQKMRDGGGLDFSALQ